MASDPRVDKMVSWGLAGFVTIALSIGGYFFNDLSSKLDTLNTTVAGLKTEVAVMNNDRQRFYDLEQAFKTHEKEMGHPLLVQQVDLLKDKLRELERKLNSRGN